VLTGYYHLAQILYAADSTGKKLETTFMQRVAITILVMVLAACADDPILPSGGCVNAVSPEEKAAD